ncbi:MAG: DUF359 domain-containing protein, partial [Candidatus Micrarchaeia archaeon]
MKINLLRHERLTLPDYLRKPLSGNYGSIEKEENVAQLLKGKQVISVGDTVTATLLRLGIFPSLAIFDFKTRRARRKSRLLERTYPKRIKVKNGQGVISYELWKAIRESIKLKHAAIQVVGEEDLAALACIH